MPETLLSFSEILLFGRVVEDLRIPSQMEVGFTAKAATIGDVVALNGVGPIDGQAIAVGDNVLVRAQNDEKQNGLYAVTAGTPLVWTQNKLPKGSLVRVENGTLAGVWEQVLPLKPNPAQAKQKFKIFPGRPGKRLGANKQLEEQLFDDDARFARIYGFAFEGAYYELPEPVLFLVHGEGDSATAGNLPYGFGSPPAVAANAPDTHQASRAPLDPSVTGVATADYQIANDIRVWTYDKADYTIRMDVLTGMFEQVLLDIFFEIEAPMIAGGRVAGGRVAGGRVAGGRVAGGRVAGGRVAGGRVSGGRVGGSGD